MSGSVFLREQEYYTRDLDPIKSYIEQASLYLSITENQPIEFCRQYITDSIRDKRFTDIRDPIVMYFERDKNGDKDKKEIQLSQYIKTINTENLILAPSFTAYLHPTTKRSMLVKFVDRNVKRRSKAKEESFVAKANNLTDLFLHLFNEQSNMKTYNNSLSGTFAALGTALNNPTAHSTLTSTTRTVTSFGNASNERIIAGNRHYWSSDIVINNIISICNDPEINNIAIACEKYQLTYPSVEQTLECIRYSSDLYWKNLRAIAVIRQILERLTPVQRAAIVYTGDLYHIRKYNDQFIRNLIDRMMTKVRASVDDPVNVIKKIDGSILNLTHQLCADEVAGMGKDYVKMSQTPGLVETLVATSNNIIATIEDYRDFIKAFFLTRNVPCSVAYIPNMVRRCVVLSDTDSTCFSTDEWVQWHRGEMIIDQTSLSISGVVGYFATQTVSHLLALFSANVNVERDKLHTLAMKNEFVFKAFAVTSVAKHYYCSIDIQEGNVFTKSEMEVKGVHLKNSSSPPSIRKHSTKMMETILETVSSGQKISLRKILTEIADKEREITQSLLKGELEFYRIAKIKEAMAYTKEAELSPYVQHLFWKDVFEPRYGVIEEPPYGVVKIATTLNNKTALKNWIDSIHDKELAQRLVNWMVKYNKTSYPTFYISSSYLRGNGMPIEITPVIDTKRIVLDLTNVYRIILESLGYFPKDDMLISELGF